MWLLLIGAAAGILVAVLLQALRRYEAEGLAAVRDRMQFLEGEMSGLQTRIQALEAIAAAEDAGASRGVGLDDADPVSAPTATGRPRDRA